MRIGKTHLANSSYHVPSSQTCIDKLINSLYHAAHNLIQGVFMRIHSMDIVPVVTERIAA